MPVLVLPSHTHVAIRMSVGHDSLKRIFHKSSDFQPLRVKHMMASTALRNDAGKKIFMRVRNSHCIIPTAADTPGDDTIGVDPGLLAHPVQDAAPQALGTGRIARFCGAVTGAWDLDGDGGPAVGDVVAGWHCVLQPVRV